MVPVRHGATYRPQPLPVGLAFFSPGLRTSNWPPPSDHASLETDLAVGCAGMAKPNPRVSKDPQLRPVARNTRGILGDVIRRKVVDLGLMRALLRAADPTDERVEPQPPTPTLPVPGDEIPLSIEEVAAAFRGRSVTSLPWIRQAAAVLDAWQMPMTAEEIERLLAGFTSHREKLGPRNGPGRSDLFVTGNDGRLTLNPLAPGLIATRRAIRGLPQPVLVQPAQRTAREQGSAIRRVEFDPEAQRNAEIARSSRRAVLSAVPSAEDPQAVALLDVGQRSIRAFIGRDVAELAGLLERFDVIAGLDIRDTLRALGFDAGRCRVVDLKPPQKSRRLNRAGRTLQITSELLIAGTTRIRRPFGDPEKVARYLSEGDHQRLARRLESDVKALHAFYQYGVLHGAVRLRWGFVDDALATDWALPGDASLHQQLKRAREKDETVDLVVGAAPGWADPWWRAQRVRVVDISFREVVLTRDEAGLALPILRDEIQAIRLAPEETEQWGWHGRQGRARWSVIQERW
ncbi:hypothetical protein [Sorangium cellulosum]|nr:hypothetical protein [Sorangium cellulosum]